MVHHDIEDHLGNQRELAPVNLSLVPWFVVRVGVVGSNEVVRVDFPEMRADVSVVMV